MEKRAIIAAVLSIAFFYGYTLLFPPAEKQATKLPPKQGAISSATKPEAAVAAPVTPVKPNPVKPAAASDITVETGLYTAVFTNEGAGLKSFVLKNYRETNAANGPRVALVNPATLNRTVFATTSQSLAIDPEDLYHASNNRVIVGKKDRSQLEFTLTTSHGYRVTKTFTFRGDSYGIEMSTRVDNTGSEKMNGGLDILIPYRVGAKTAETRFEISEGVTFSENKLKTETLKDIDGKTVQFERNILWTGFADKYFANVLIAGDGNIGSVRTAKAGNEVIQSTVSSPSFTLKPGESHTVSYRLFLGPKDIDILKSQGSNLDKVVDLGWFSAIAKPLLQILKYFYSYTHNYGVAIIIITVIIKILFFPLTHKSYKSMKEMQKLQPMMTELREKHKNDRDALNKATMELYKTHKVNPLGGCLPMVIQIPVFFALYKALMFSIELRHAPFIWWITDLSAKDPYYITPIIMGATMFIQQKMTPSTMDPMQAKMMLALPVVFTFMFLNFPSGLVIYWLVNNILTIAQQAYINRMIKE